MYTLWEWPKFNEICIYDQDYQVDKISRSHFSNTDNPQENQNWLRLRILESWASLDHFFTNGLGFVIMHKKEIVSTCFSQFVAGNVHSIAIETLSEHQGKKLAQKNAQMFVSECFRNNLIPYWDCMASNKPSIAVAEKIGFRQAFTYTGYEFPFD